MQPIIAHLQDYADGYDVRSAFATTPAAHARRIHEHIARDLPPGRGSLQGHQSVAENSKDQKTEGRW